MTGVEMRTAKKMLHKVIVDTIVMFKPNSNEELDELWNYVKTLAEAELNA